MEKESTAVYVGRLADKFQSEYRDILAKHESDFSEEQRATLDDLGATIYGVLVDVAQHLDSAKS